MKREWSQIDTPNKKAAEAAFLLNSQLIWH